MGRIRAHHAPLGAHLERAIRTGASGRSATACRAHGRPSAPGGSGRTATEWNSRRRTPQAMDWGTRAQPAQSAYAGAGESGSTPRQSVGSCPRRLEGTTKPQAARGSAPGSESVRVSGCVPPLRRHRSRHNALPRERHTRPRPPCRHHERRQSPRVRAQAPRCRRRWPASTGAP
jgi:hypothetical protein